MGDTIVNSEMNTSESDVITHINQLKSEMRANVGDIMNQINQLRLEMRSSMGDMMSQVNLLRTEMKKNINNQDLESRNQLLEELHRVQRENNDLRTELHHRVSTQPQLLAAYHETALYAHHEQMIPGRLEPASDEENGPRMNGVKLIEIPNVPIEQASASSSKKKRKGKKRAAPIEAVVEDDVASVSSASSGSKRSISSQKVSASATNGAHDMDPSTVNIGSRIEIPKDAYSKFSDKPMTVYLRSLLELVFGKDVLASSTLAGKSNKPPLHEELVKDIVGDVLRKFDVEEAIVRKYIVDRCYIEGRKKSSAY